MARGDAGTPGPDEVGSSAPSVTKAQIPLVLAAGQDGHELSEQAPDKGTGHGRGLPHRRAGRGARRTRASSSPSTRVTAEGRARVAGRRRRRLPPVQRQGRPPGGDPQDRAGEPGPHQGRLHRQDRQRAGHPRPQGDQGRQEDQGRLQAVRAVHVQPARPRVDHPGDDPAADALLPRQLRHGPARSRRSSTPPSCGSSCRPTPTATTTRFTATATACGARTCATTTATAKITTGDGVDLNRNFAYKWGYDNEGSSPNPASETYRGTGPASEPETKALDAFEKRIGFTYVINYHSAAELLLYGVGWQVATPTPDDVALQGAGRRRRELRRSPATTPQVSAELYTTNGETDGHAANVNGMAMFTPEMSTCQTASDLDPDDEWNAADCAAVFNFPDDEKLIQAEFEKNIPFALSVAETAAQPRPARRPRSASTPPDFTPAAFTTSYSRGADQEVSVVVRKSRTRQGAQVPRQRRPYAGPWRSRRGRAARPTAARTTSTSTSTAPRSRTATPATRSRSGSPARPRSGKPTSSTHFTYTVAERPAADTLVVAEEGATATQAQTYVDALKANGRKAAVWDVATQGAPTRSACSATSGRPSTTPARATARQRHPAPAARLPQRGRQADRGGRAGRRQRRPRRRHPDRTTSASTTWAPTRRTVDARAPPASPAPARSTASPGARRRAAATR